MVESQQSENTKVVTNPFLNDVPSDNFFVMSNGFRFGSLDTMYSSIRDSDQGVFYNHVTSDRNDFANWIRGCIKDTELADKLNGIKEREVFLGMLAEEIALLKNSKILKTLEYFKEDGNIGLAQPTLNSSATNLNQNPIGDKTTQQSNAASNTTTSASNDSQIAAVSNAQVSTAEQKTTISNSSTPVNSSNISDPSNPVTSDNAVKSTIDSSTGSSTQDDVTYDFESILKSIIDEIQADIDTWSQ